MTTAVKTIKVCGLLRDDGACGFYRVDQPLTKLAQHSGGGFKRELLRPGEPAEVGAKKIDADIVVMPRPNSESFYKKLLLAQELGKKVVIDHDDNVFQVSPLSPHFEEFGTEEVTIEFEDGKTFRITDEMVNFKANRERIDWIRRCMEKADAVTVTTARLATIYSEFNGSVYVLPNCVDLNIWKPVDIVKDGTFRIGWQGGFSHYEDFVILRDVLPRILKQYKQVVFVGVGHNWEGVLKKCPREQIEFCPWAPTAAHPYRMALLNLDLQLIPLRETVFNAHKSEIKWAEAGALGCPAVTSYVAPYDTLYEPGNGAFVENRTENWITGISMLIDDSILRAAAGRQARSTVKNRFDADLEWIKWERAYMEILNS